ncbi:MAG: hypothetical protein V2I47_11345 [Bacteroidales bacterium]|jgi:hypothetical protein|nr:hypothetical protein [Bacteroidales bacterium]
MIRLNTLIFIVFTCIPGLIQAQSYSTQLKSIFISEIEYARLQHIKSALDGQGNIHMVFTGHESRLFYGTNSTGSWSFQKIQYLDEDYGDSTDIAYYPNIAVDGNDRLHITFFGRYKEQVYHGSKAISGNLFETKPIKSTPRPLRFYVYGEYTDMAIDQNDGLHLICRADYTDQAEYKYNEAAIYFFKPGKSDDWQLQVLLHDNKMYDENNWFFGNNSSIACHENKVYTALGGSNKLNFGSKPISGGSWETEELLYTHDEFINSGKDNLSLGISSRGDIKFAFFDRTDDEGSPIHGLGIYSRNKNCGPRNWMLYNKWSTPLNMNCPAIAFNKHDKAYLALGQNGFALYEQTCDCDGEYLKIFEDDQNSADYVDMLIDDQDKVHVFFTSNYDNELHYLTAIPKAGTTVCNYPPEFTAYTGKTNVGPGEEWTGSVSAEDMECDKIDFYTIIKPDFVTINDHGNGTADIHAIIPEGEGFGEVVFTIFARDALHQDIDSKVSAISFILKLTQEGNEEGYVKVENKCVE